MALTPATITAAIMAAGPDLLGPTFPLVATGVGTAVYTWAVSPTNYLLNGITAGSPGPPGLVLGKITVVPEPSLVYTVAVGSGLAGPTAVSLTRAVAIGVATAFSSSAQYTGDSTGVAAGTDTSGVVIANAAALVALLKANLPQGPTSIILAQGLGAGLAALLQTATGFGTVQGVPVATAVVPGYSKSSVY